MRPPTFRPRFFGRALAVATLALGTLAVLAASAGAAIAPESAHSPNADDIRLTYWVMLVVASVIGAVLLGGLLVTARRFRARGEAAPRRLAAGPGALGRVSAALGVAALAIFVFGVVMTDRTRNATADESGKSLDIDVVGQQWLWRFEYPAQEDSSASPGIATVFAYKELVVPVDTTVNLSIDSVDVLHRWFIPALGGQVDAVPGEVAETSFRADEEGVYEGQSMQFSGTMSPAMRASVRVVSAEEYEAYVDGLAADLAAGQQAVQERLGAEESAEESEGADLETSE